MKSGWVRAGCAAVTVAALSACSFSSSTGDRPSGSGTPSASASPSGRAPASGDGQPGGGPGGGPDSGTTSAELQSAFESTIVKVRPSIVLIRTSKDLGSGVVFDDRGDIVTNDHVVGDATSFHVHVSGSAKSFTAERVGAYPPDDLAVIRLDGSAKVQPASFADSSKVRVGQVVLAIGNPLGLAGSVTNGIVSAVGRTVNEPEGKDSPGATLPDMIQTSAAINPGNSGGALVDLNGRVVGIPTLAATDRQVGGQAPGIGFAISSNVVKDIAGQIVAHGKVTNSHRAALGVRVTTMTGPDGRPEGVGIVDVESKAATKAGLSSGQVIVALGGKTTRTEKALADVLAGLEPGSTVKVKVKTHAGNKKTVKVVLGSLPG